jgi:hypothetical protein
MPEIGWRGLQHPTASILAVGVISRNGVSGGLHPLAA